MKMSSYSLCLICLFIKNGRETLIIRVRETLIIDTELETDYPKPSYQTPSYSQSDCPYEITYDSQQSST